MSRSWLLVLLAILPLGFLAGAPDPARADEDGDRVVLAGPDAVGALRLGDVDGDGRLDLVALDGREVRVWRGLEGRLPAPNPTWRVEVPSTAAFVDLAPPDDDAAPALLVLGRDGLRRLPLGGGEAAPAVPGEDGAGLDWVDAVGATFTALTGPDGSLAVPVAAGWRWYGPAGSGQGPVSVAVPIHRLVESPGRFLEDEAVITRAWPRLHVGPPPEGAPAGSLPLLWTLGGPELIAVHGEARQAWDVSFLPSAGDRRLIDLDGDGAPEVIHRETTNRTGTYAFFRPARPAIEDGALAAKDEDLREERVVLRLTGFQLEPDFVDLDGDGRLDFAITTIPIDARNTMRALGGLVTANTYAFLNRRRGPGSDLYATTPDARVASDVGVAIRFSPAGNIEVERSFTILTTGDYDGDGRCDLAIRTGPDTLTIRAGTPGGVWAETGREVAIPPAGEGVEVEGQPADLDGDGRDELILTYRAAPGTPDRLLVLRPR